MLRDQGVASLYQAVSSSHEVPERVLARPSGERFMTDLRHIAQLLHEAGASEGLGPTAMATWLGRRIHDAARDGENEERARRLESDAEAVQVITIHRSKGLEFPIVFCPYMWDGRPGGKDKHVPMFHNPDNANARTIDVGREGNRFAQHQKMELEESRGEDLRLLYVALTRARHQAILWWAGANDSQHSPLARLLFDRDAQGVVGPYGAKTRSDAEVESTLGGLGPCVSVERVGAPSTERWEEDAGPPPFLEAAVVRPDARRRLAEGVVLEHHPCAARGARRGERAGATVDVGRGRGHHAGGPGRSRAGAGAGPDAADGAVALGLADMPGGALVGTVVHGVFEHTEFDAPDLTADGDRGAGRRGGLAQRRPRGTPKRSSPASVPPSSPPSGPWLTTSACATSPAWTGSTSSTFEIPLVGGDTPSANLHVAEVADMLEQHLPVDDPVSALRPALRDPALGGVLRGYLTGSLDLVFRLPGDRFVLADYKTNKLATPEDTLTAWHYRPEALQAEMVAAHYPLQALLYTVALHRYLRWRLRGYDPGVHLGGVLYLFVRGMSASRARQGRAAVAVAVAGRVVLAATGRPDRGAERPLRPGGARRERARGRRPVRRPASCADVEGLLQAFNRAGLLSTSDVHVALRLSRLGGTHDDVVALGAAFAARAPRLGNVCVDLATIHATADADTEVPADLGALPWPEPATWLRRLAASPVVGVDRPLHLEGSTLYLDRLWADECLVAVELRCPFRRTGARCRSGPAAPGRRGAVRR